MNFTNLKRALAIGCVSTIGLMGCTGPVNEQTTQDMPTGYLCRLLDSNEYISTPAEQRAMYGELERRGAECAGQNNVVINIET